VTAGSTLKIRAPGWTGSPVCCTIVTVRLPSGFVVARPTDQRLVLWLGSLLALAALNVALWIWIARVAVPNTRYAQIQLLLSGVYVGVCGFRSLFPRVDLERVCLWDTWLSGIVIGRTAATLAELCFAMQCGLFVQRWADIAGMPLLHAGGQALVPLAILAEVVCWYAVLSLNHIGHAIEETLWALLMILVSAGFGAAAQTAAGPLRVLLIVGSLVYGVGAVLTMSIDVRMYLKRWRLHAEGVRMSLVTGLRDSHRRRHPTMAWEVWREEVPWMTVYFSIGVWTSLAMVLL
jgi:hypothetical protein